MVEQNRLVESAAELINWIDSQIGEPTFAHSVRTTTSATLSNLGRQHHRAIIRLVECDLPASAAALLRVIFECYVRALWVHECATEPELQGALDDKWPRFGEMVRSIEAVPHLKNGVLQAAASSRWRAFNSFTHNGTLALAKQLRGGEIAPKFASEEIEDIVRFANAIGLMIAAHMAVLAKNSHLAQALVERVRSYSKGP